MIEILVGAIALFFVLALVIISRNKYVQWLERKLAMARKELKQLRNERQQPWLQGATTEYHLQKRITELETEIANMHDKLDADEVVFRTDYEKVVEECNRLYGIGQEYDARVKSLEKALEANVSKSVFRRLKAQIK